MRLKLTGRAFLTLLLLLALRPGGAAVSQTAPQGRVVRGRLEEVTGRRLVALLVSRAMLLDVRDPAATAFDDYRRALAGAPPPLHVAAARRIADKLNKNIRKYRWMSAAHSYAEADLFIVFKVTEQHRSAVPGEPYVWGKMYVLAVGADRVARLVWESKDDEVSPEDATGDFLKTLKSARGER